MTVSFMSGFIRSKSYRKQIRVTHYFSRNNTWISMKVECLSNYSKKCPPKYFNCTRQERQKWKLKLSCRKPDTSSDPGSYIYYFINNIYRTFTQTAGTLHFAHLITQRTANLTKSVKSSYLYPVNPI